MTAGAPPLPASKRLKIWDISPAVDEQVAVPSHHQLLAHGLRVLENLVLDDVAEGNYELIALPLKLLRTDASPVRAILRELPLTPALSPEGRGSNTTA